MWYAIISEDVEDSLELRAKVRQAHVARLQALVDEGRLLTAGPHPAIDAENPGSAGFTGSLVIADFPSLTDAQAWADADPYVEAGVYEKVLVKPYRKVLP
ncbi:MAG: YciI family protein [Gammaproteobacteria bacterium]|nr:YciI family protein [Pseudomonadota bacterium]TDJ11803.1 MAG: YciI family protein [Gammaproteobacteria bacterium]